MKRFNNYALSLFCVVFVSCLSNPVVYGQHRQIINLNGQWDIAQTIDSVPPQAFSGKIQVPGLLDLAQPAFDSVGYSSEQRRYFWYRKTIKADFSDADFAYLKIHKAKFGHALYVNGHYVGKYDFCFTPSYFNVYAYWNHNSSNEILIRVGASPEALPDSIPYGFDIEKSMYYPGIYDRVELFAAQYPYIENVQVVPNIEKQKIKAVVYLENGPKSLNTNLAYEVNEKNEKPTSFGASENIQLLAHEKKAVVLDIDARNLALWSPENPIIHELMIKSNSESKGDSIKVRFGMREFRFDPQSRLALLNGKPYYLRGTNIAMHRFFEDPERQSLPWDKDWICAMHKEFKSMHWNSYRFHVGFAPELWYETADDSGFLIQDEYAIWALFLKDSSLYSTRQYDRHRASVLAQEYARWMRERWNHPSVVIWDAQNETWWDETGKALESVRHLDLSDRPWDNGFSPPQRPTDMIESHPYLFAHNQALTFTVDREYPPEGLLNHDLSKRPDPFNDPNLYEPPTPNEKYPNPVIVNEYAWIWLYRDGSPASVAEKIWSFYPELDTPEKRWDWRGRVVAAKTEYWRSRRDIAGVQHFCALTCNRPWEPRSQVSDEWQNVSNLKMQPAFKKYVKAAFSPVGLMIDRWDKYYEADQKVEVPIILYNDLYSEWSGRLSFKILKDNKELYSDSQHVAVESLGKTQTQFTIQMPAQKGHYELIAEISWKGERVFTTRLFEVR